jgi:hypothetical protein
MLLFTTDGIFGDDLDPRFHRSPSDIGELSFEDNEIANSDGMMKVHLINCDRYHSALRVSHRRERTCLIDQLHDPSTVHIAP